MIGSLPLLPIAVGLLPAVKHPLAGVLFFLALILTGLAGFGLGRRYVPRAVQYASGFRMPSRLFIWILIGLAWGMLSGAAGGAVILLIGSILGAIIGGVVGAVTVPIMIGLHTLMRAGDFIEAKHFLPIAFGITLPVCALVLGLYLS